MKKKIFRSIIIIFVLIAMITPVLCFTASAASDSSVAATSGKKVHGNTGQRRPYTKNLEEINKKLDDLAKEEEKGFWKKGVKELKSLSTIDKGVALGINTLADILKDPQNADWAKIGYDFLKSGVSLVASAFGLGGVAEAVFSFFEAISGSSPQKSEIEQLQDHLDEQFEVVNEGIEDIREDLEELSSEVSASIAAAVESLRDAIAAQAAGNEVIKFTSSGDGNFDYTLFKEYLFGVSDGSIGDNAYYDILLKSIVEEDDDLVIEENYKALYRSLNSRSRYGISNVDMLRQYILKNEYGKESIQRYYYDWLISNRELLGDKSAEFEAISFALDLYRSYLFAEYCTSFCNQYFLIRMYEIYGAEINDNSIYRYGANQDEYITFGQLKRTLLSNGEEDTELVNQMVDDIVYMFNMEGSFLLENDGEINACLNDNPETFGQVSIGQTVYMNRLADYMCESFGFDPQGFKYKWVDKDGDVVINDGIYSVTEEGGFSATLMYGDAEIYSISFSVNNNSAFAGGNGTEADPYLIKTAEQFLLMYSEEKAQEKSYKLISDIDLYGTAIPVFCSDSDKPFIGTFNGNGYAIRNATINDYEYAGLFGIVGDGGIVKNLTLDSFSVGIYGNTEPVIYIGGIAAVNEGLIYNCHIKSSSVVVDAAYDHEEHYNKNIEVRAGGIVGACREEGIISFCSVTGNTSNKSSVNVNSSRFYGSYSDSKNGNYVYAGGIAGALTEKAKISNCYVDSNTKVYSKADSRCNASYCRRTPYVTSLAGGIAGYLAQSSIVSNVYVEKEIAIAEKNCQNVCGDFFLGFENQSKCTCKPGKYVPLEDIEGLSSLDEIALPTGNEYHVSYTFLDTKNNEYNYFDSQLYCYDEDFLKTKQLKLSVNGIELSSYDIINFYGLDTTNSDKIDGEALVVTVVFSATINDEPVILTVDIPVFVKKIEMTGISIEAEPEKTTYDRFDEVSLEGGSFLLHWEDGSSEPITPIVSPGATDNFGTNEVTLSYEGLTASYKVTVICEHICNTSTTAATCTSIGYTEDACTKCDYSYKYNFVEMLPHTVILKGYQAATCTNTGYTGDEYCSDCEDLLSYGEVIQILPHIYKSVDGNTCKCTECGKTEKHEYSSIENSECIIYYCSKCGYRYTVEKKNTSDITRVVVGNSFGVYDSDNEIVVYIKIFKNPGIAGVSFRIEYDNRLEYVRYERGELLSSASEFEVVDSNGVVGFVAASADESCADGNLLKLVFKLPDDAKVMDKFAISIALTGDRFANGKADTIDIVTHPGSITAVSHLPGDVNSDGFVDILDTALVARYIAIMNTKDSQGFEENLNAFLSSEDYTFSEFYADVNLDGSLTINDLVIMLQYFVGKNFYELQSNEFEVILNPNNGSLETDSIIVKCYDESGKRGVYPELPTPTRPGYRFDGWYLSLDVSDLEKDRIKAGGEVVYNPSYLNQTLYAHWTEIYTVSYNINAPINASEAFGNMKDDVFEFDETRELSPLGFEIVGWTFKGWATDENGDVVYANKAAVSKLAKAGEVVNLYAVWEANTYSVQYMPNKPTNAIFAVTGSMPNIEKCTYDEFFVLDKVEYMLTGWHFVGWATSSDGEAIYSNEANIKNLTAKDNSVVRLYAVWEANEYTITFNTDGGTEIAPITQKHCSGITAPANPTRVGYTFAGWDKEIPKTMPAENVTITAKWTINQYTIAFDTNGGTGIAPITQDYGTTIVAPANPTKEGYTFLGWDKVIPETMSAESITITASWKINKYTVSYIIDGEEYDSESYEFGEDIVYPTVNVTGHTFSGWSYGLEDAPLTMPAKDIVISGTLTVNNYKLNYYVDGELYDTKTYAYGEEITLIAEPTADGKVFSGWLCTTLDTLPATMPAFDIRIDGGFDQTTFHIYYYIDDILVKTESVNKGFGINAYTPADKEGYTFYGWYMKYDGSNEKMPSIMPTCDISVDARYIVNQYTITFDTNGGSEIASITQDYGTAIVAPANPTKIGFAFGGWAPSIPSSMPAENITVSAVWEQIPYTIKFFSNKPFTSNFEVVGEMAEASAIYNIDFVLPACNYFIESWIFEGWSTTPEGDVEYNDESTVCFPEALSAGTLMLYAQWRPITYYVLTDIYDCNDVVEVKYGESYTLSWDSRWKDSFINSVIFDGWYYSGEGYDLDAGIRGNMTTLLTTESDYTIKNWTTVDGTYVCFYGEVHLDNSCFTGDTMVALDDGSYARLDSLKVGDVILSWNAFAGKFEEMPISLFWNHGENWYNVITLNFSNGKTVKVVTEHGFFDSTLNKYVYITHENFSDYIGHEFACMSEYGDFEDVALVSAECNYEYSSCYSLRTACNDNAIVEGFMTLTHEDIPGFLTYFEFGENYKYDQEKIEADIAKYGLYTYDDWKDYVSYEEFIALNGQYLTIVIGKGYLTYDDVLKLIAGMR